MIIRQLQSDDISIIETIEPFAEATDGWQDVIDKDLSYTLEQDGKPIACGGVIVGKEAMFWMRSDGTHIVKMMRAAKAVVQILTEVLGNMVYSTLVLEGFDKGDKFIRRLGFRKTDISINNNDRIYNRYELCHGQ